MSEVLRKAAIEIFGFYDNGAGVERPPAAHEVLADVNHEEYGIAMDGISAAIQQANEVVKDQDVYEAFHAVSAAAQQAVETSAFKDGKIAKVATSDISAQWIVEASPSIEEVRTLSELVMKSRSVAREFLKLFWWKGMG